MRLQVVGPNSTVQVLSLAPPPEDLIAKTVIEDEPVKTGAAIAFIKFQRLIGKEKLERMNMEKAQGAEGNAGKGDGDKNQNWFEPKKCETCECVATKRRCLAVTSAGRVIFPCGAIACGQAYAPLEILNVSEKLDRSGIKVIF